MIDFKRAPSGMAPTTGRPVVADSPRLPARADRAGRHRRLPAPTCRAPVDRATAPPRTVARRRVEADAVARSRPAPAPSRRAAPAANSNGKFSLSRQLGLSVSRIVIDAGHGGHDPGAQGNGINEAELTLDVALRLQKLLEKQPGVEVVMTRDTDVFIPLEERTAIANREGADLFLSIHANASRNAEARGIETYFLNFAIEPRSGSGRRARERGVGPDDAQPARTS